MNREAELDRAIREHFEKDTVPEQVHQAILSACQTLPERSPAWDRERLSLPRKAADPFTRPDVAEKPSRASWQRRLSTALLCAAVILLFGGALYLNAFLPGSPERHASSEFPPSSLGQFISPTVSPSPAPSATPSQSPAPSGNDKLLQDLEAALDFQLKTDYYITPFSVSELLALVKDPDASNWEDILDWPAICQAALENPPDFNAYLADSRYCETLLDNYRNRFTYGPSDNPEVFITNLTVSAGVTDVRLLAVEDLSETEKNVTFCRTAWDVAIKKEDGGCRISSHYFQYTSIHQMILEDGDWKLGDLLADTFYNNQTDNTSFSSPVEALRYVEKMDPDAENPFRDAPDPTNLPLSILLDEGWEQNGVTLRSAACYGSDLNVVVELGGEYAGKGADDFTKFDHLPTLKLYYSDGSKAFLTIGSHLTDGRLTSHFDLSEPELEAGSLVLKVVRETGDETGSEETLAEFSIDLINRSCAPLTS